MNRCGGSTKHFRLPRVKRRDEESCPSRALTPKKRKTRLAGGSTKHFRWPKMKRRDEESSPSDVLTPKERKTRLAGGTTKHFGWPKANRRDEESSPSDALTLKKRKTRLAGSSTKHFRRSNVKRRDKESSPSDALTPKKRKTRLAGGSTKHLRPPKVKRLDEGSSPSDALTPKIRKARLAGGSTEDLHRSKAEHRNEESSPSDAFTPKKKKTRLAESSPSDAFTPKKRKTRLAGGSTKHLRPPKVKRCDEESSPSDALTPKIKKTHLAGGSTKHFRCPKVKRRDEESSPSRALTPKKRKTRLAGGCTKHLHRSKAERRNEESSPSDALTPKKKKTLLAGGSTKHLRPPKVKRLDEESSPIDALTPKIRKTRLAVMQGVPSDDDLEWLSRELEEWKTVGRRLKIKEAKLTAFDIEKRRYSEKIYKMLLHWKRRNGSTATYTILHDALCHPWVNRTDLAEQLITDISTGEESCKSGDPSGNKRRRQAEPLNVEKCQEKLKSYYDTISNVKIVPWDESSSIGINQIYTPLNWVRYHRRSSGVTQEELEDYTDMFKGKPTRMLVYGRPGIGKSTFCKKAAYDWSKALKEILMNFSILLLIKLRDVCDVGNIPDVLLASKLLASDGPISVDSLYDYIVNNQDKVLLILDGYDEYSFAEERSPILAIWKGEQLRDCHVIVTTRQLECDELRGPSHVQLEIQGLKSREQKETFARKLLAGEEDPDEFMSYLYENNLGGMAKIPLLLLMLCILWKKKHHVGLLKSRADIFTQFIQTMLDHKGGSRQPRPFQNVTSTEAKEDLSNLGKAAFEALLQDRLYVRCSELPDNISRSFQKLREVGLFQIVNLTSLNPEKGAYFIHKSLQEFLAAWHIKEEVLSIKGESTPSLSKVESFEKIMKMDEVLKFACELSTEAACAVFHHVGSVGRKESVSVCDFIELLLEDNEELPSNEELYLELISHSYFCCSAEKRRDLCSAYLSCTEGLFLDLDSNKLNIAANEHLLKSGMIPNFIFFRPYFLDDYSEKSYRDLITVAEDTNAVFLSCSGEKKAADLLKKFPRRSLSEFFFKRERKIVVYVYQIRKYIDDITFPTEMLRELISPTAESTQVTRLVDPLNEHDSERASSLTQNTDSITGPTRRSLSCVKRISIYGTERQDIKMLADFLPLFTALRWILIFGIPPEIIDAQLTETLVSRIIFTDRLGTLVLVNINLTAKPAAVIARSLRQAPGLQWLDLSENPLGEGVSVLIQHLSRVPHLERLRLSDVKMTKQQVNELSTAVRQSKISWLNTQYHDDKGNVKPEEQWPTDEYWGDDWSESEEESDPGSVINSGDDEEPGSFTASGD
ncbi:NLR family CARD domain-containing protein 4 [Pocillopora verrucosa]|uniref:NLR family CARD domain-containing protein 4 n=1 Tax=Pocillopora verrucosa TaxID=203993 RepID=UPI0033411E44